MNSIPSRTLLFVLLISGCTCTALNKGNNVHKSNNQMTGNIPITATTSEMPNLNVKPNDTEIALLVVRKSLRFAPSDICGGILVSARIVITAAHCFYDSHGLYRHYPHMFRVVYGRSGIYQNVAMEGPSAVSVISHPNYNENYQSNDIGAIRLQDNLDVGSTRIAGQLLPLAQIWNDHAQLEMLVFFVENEVLQTVTAERMAARLISKHKCEEAYHRWGIHINPKQLCIEQADPEYYHRGESAILLLNGHPIGVLSFKFDVTSRTNMLPYIYTELSGYSEFIQKEIHTDAALRLKPYRICSSILYVVISMGVVK